MRSLPKKLPKKVKVCVIERKGNPMKGEILTVGEKTWDIDKKITKTDIKKVDEYVINTVKDISETYKVFEKLLTLK
jgi:co-chaperonin GroES (HSP10)